MQRTKPVVSKYTNRQEPNRRLRLQSAVLTIFDLTYCRWTAICRGAVFKALTNSSLPGTIVQSRISRCNYGTRYQTDFNPRVHLDCDKYIDHVSGRPKARRQIEWYLKRVGIITHHGYRLAKIYQGDNISETTPVNLPWHTNVIADHNYHPLSAYIFACNDKEPPS